MSAAGGLMYTAGFQSQSLTTSAQNIWEIIAAAGVTLLIHNIRITWTPVISSGVAQDQRLEINIQTITTTGTGGTGVTPSPINKRNTLAASTTFNRMVTTVGTLGVVLDPEVVSVIVPFERSYTVETRIPISGGNRLAVNYASGLGAAMNISSEIEFEEI